MIFEVIIADPDTDRELPRNEIGEILLPEGAFCFNVGYFKMPDKTVEAWRNLWFHTGDAGHMDPEGRLFLLIESRTASVGGARIFLHLS